MNYDNKKECALCNYWRIYMTGIHKCSLEDGNCPYDKNKEGGEAISILSDMVGDNDNKQTNADRIRNMSDDELADTLFDDCLEVMHKDECHADVGMCKKCISEWLQSEVKTEESEEKQ